MAETLPPVIALALMTVSPASPAKARASVTAAETKSAVRPIGDSANERSSALLTDTRPAERPPPSRRSARLQLSRGP